MSRSGRNPDDFSSKDKPVILRINRLNSAGAEQLHSLQKLSERHIPSATVPLSKSSSKSADSLDSGIYSRQKSCDSMDSLDSNDSGNGEQSSLQKSGLYPTPTDEAITATMPFQYEDYLRECQDIRQSIIITSNDQEKLPVSRTDSGDDQDEDSEGDWLRMAGLSDLVVPQTSSGPVGMVSSRMSSDSLSSMTVLSTLTRPQREAVLRRITSFNRAQKSKKRPKPAISAIFPTCEIESPKSGSPKSLSQENSPTFPSKDSLSRKNDELTAKSTSLPRDVSGFGDGYTRRYSETPRPRSNHGDVALSQAPSNANESKDYRYKHKKSVESIVATETSGVSDVASSRASDSVDGGNVPGYVFTSCMLSDNVTDRPCHSYASSSLPDLRPTDEPDVAKQTLKNKLTRVFVKKSPSKRSADRNQKALSDIPSSALLSKPENTSRHSLTSENLHQNTGQVAVTPSANSAFSFVLSPSQNDNQNSKDKSSRHSAPPTTIDKLVVEGNSNPTSPGRSRFRLSPHFSFSSKRRSPNSSPFKRRSAEGPTEASNLASKRDSKLSPLHKVTEMTLSSLGSPSRTGSYQLQTSPTRKSKRKSIRRAKSLKISDSRAVSLVSVRSTPDADFSADTEPCIETLSIHQKRGDDPCGWGSARDDLPDDPNKEKSMSYTEKADQANLPNFSLVKDRLGITKISDLSPVDMRKVQSLALIELTALFDLRGIELKRRKVGKSKVKESGVFGLPLTTLVDSDQKRLGDPLLRVPLVLKEIISFLEENALQDEGILRKSGSAARIKLLKQNMEARYSYSTGNTTQQDGGGSGSGSMQSESQVFADAHPNDVATILKQFLRELPDPLLTSEYIDAFQSCGLIQDRKEQLQALNLLIILLHQVHRDSLKLLLKFLEHVVSAEQWNKMSLNNVAMITAPNLFMGRKQSKKESSSTSQDLKHAAGTSNIVRMLIKYNKLLWTIPAFMLTQVRHMNRAELSSKKPSNQKHKMKFFPGKTKDAGKKTNLSITHQPFDFDTPKGVIRVQAPDMIMTSMAVQLDNVITAGDIIARFERQCERINPAIVIDNKTHALYEVGGNIHERCLHPDTNMNALIRVNPDTSWVIKPRTWI